MSGSSRFLSQYHGSSWLIPCTVRTCGLSGAIGAGFSGAITLQTLPVEAQSQAKLQ